MRNDNMLSSIEEIIEDARNGRMFILVDDEARENEGDLVIPAQMATPNAINFMAKYGRGLICLALPQARVKELGLSLMARHNGARHPDGVYGFHRSTRRHRGDDRYFRRRSRPHDCGGD